MVWLRNLAVWSVMVAVLPGCASAARPPELEKTQAPVKATACLAGHRLLAGAFHVKHYKDSDGADVVEFRALDSPTVGGGDKEAGPCARVRIDNMLNMARVELTGLPVVVPSTEEAVLARAVVVATMWAGVYGGVWSNYKVRATRDDKGIIAVFFQNDQHYIGAGHFMVMVRDDFVSFCPGK
jgi:hypothetical protein